MTYVEMAYDRRYGPVLNDRKNYHMTNDMQQLGLWKISIIFFSKLPTSTYHSSKLVRER